MSTLRLEPVHANDQDAVFALSSDPALWTHFPSGRSDDPEKTRESLARWTADWAREGLGYWAARESDGTVVGVGGVRRNEVGVWNLYYRIAASRHGRGYAREIAEAALDAAKARRPDVPVVAYLLAHNLGSKAVAERVGLRLQWQGPDAGNPDPSAVRLIYADRTLREDVLAAVVAYV